MEIAVVKDIATGREIASFFIEPDAQQWIFSDEARCFWALASDAGLSIVMTEVEYTAPVVQEETEIVKLKKELDTMRQLLRDIVDDHEFIVKMEGKCGATWVTSLRSSVNYAKHLLRQTYNESQK